MSRFFVIFFTKSIKLFTKSIEITYIWETILIIGNSAIKSVFLPITGAHNMRQKYPKPSRKGLFPGKMGLKGSPKLYSYLSTLFIDTAAYRIFDSELEKSRRN